MKGRRDGRRRGGMKKERKKKKRVDLGPAFYMHYLRRAQ